MNSSLNPGRRNFLWGAAVVIGGGSLGLGASQALSLAAESGDPNGVFPNVALTSHEGNSYRFYDDLIRGKKVVINFMYLNCNDICPLQTSRVAQIRPCTEGAPASAEFQLTARLIGRLYDAVDWPDAPADLLEQVRASAGIPIYDGLATAHHPTADLAGLLDAESSLADRRRFVLQAVLLATMI